MDVRDIANNTCAIKNQMIDGLFLHSLLSFTNIGPFFVNMILLLVIEKMDVINIGTVKNNHY
jgi:hypothetical protein